MKGQNDERKYQNKLKILWELFFYYLLIPKNELWKFIFWSIMVICKKQ